MFTSSIVYISDSAVSWSLQSQTPRCPAHCGVWLRGVLLIAESDSAVSSYILLCPSHTVESHYWLRAVGMTVWDSNILTNQQWIQNCLSNPELIRNLKEEIKTASKELVKQVMEFVLKHFSNSETRNKEIFNNANNIINNFILNFN